MSTSKNLVRLCWLVAALMIASAGRAEESQKIAELGSCALQSGKVVLDCQVGCRTFGTLSADASNVVVMPSWLNGRSEDLAPFFGENETGHRLVDTSRFFGVAFDAFGDGVSSSPSNSRRQHGPEFPLFTMEDMVRAQYRVLTEVLHVRHVHAAVGLSMGGEQVFAWAVLFPQFVDLAVPIVGTPQVTSFDLLSKQIVIDAIEADPEYKHGRYVAEPQLKLANAIGTMIVSAPQYRNAEVPRSKFAEWLKTVESPQRQDANDRMWQAKAIMHHDVLHGRTIEEVARGVPVKFLVIVAAEDRMVTPQPALEWAKAVGAETYISPGSCAHLIMSCDAEAVSSRVKRFLAR
jgi:homoserine O-acetyltransferase